MQAIHGRLLCLLCAAATLTRSNSGRLGSMRLHAGLDTVPCSLHLIRLLPQHICLALSPYFSLLPTTLSLHLPPLQHHGRSSSSSSSRSRSKRWRHSDSLSASRKKAKHKPSSQEGVPSCCLCPCHCFCLRLLVLRMLPQQPLAQAMGVHEGVGEEEHHADVTHHH